MASKWEDFLWWLNCTIGFERLTFIICAVAIAVSVAAVVISFVAVASG